MVSILTLTRTFKTSLEAQVSHGGTYKIPEEMDESYIILKTGWTIFEVRATPVHIIEKLRLHWHLENMQRDYNERQAKPR